LGFAIGIKRRDTHLVARNGLEDAVVVGLRGELAKADARLAFVGLLRLRVARVVLASIQATLGNIVAGCAAPLKGQIRGRRLAPMAIGRGLAARKIM